VEDAAAVRIVVVPAGHGVQYMLTLEPRPGEEDITLEHDGLRIVVDRESAFLVEGAEALMASDRM
jgi:Fe-S cluster assembly iron-binding protein IscA